MENSTDTALSLHELAAAMYVLNHVLPHLNPAALLPEQRNGLQHSLEQALNRITDYLRRATPPGTPLIKAVPTTPNP